MDVQALPISPTELYRHLGTAKAPLLIDVRRAPAFDADDQRIIGAARRLPDDLASWSNALPKERAVVAYCVHGHEVSQGVASALQNAGFQAAYLEGGIAGLERPQVADPPQTGCHRKQMGHAGASQDRPDCLPVAREPLHQSRGGIHLCATK